LPAGLSFDPATGVISGTPTGPISKHIDTITAYNAAGYSTTIITLPPSNIATLATLVPNAGTLSPAFVSATSSYADSVSTAVAGITLTPTTTDSTATVTINGTTVASGTASGDLPLLIGDNNITVVVTAQDGVTTDTYTVDVYRGAIAASLAATNVLTPNGDGKNDFWKVKDIQLYPQNTVNVFNQAGKTVFAKRGYNNDWDGTLNGKPLPQGTYYYVVDLGPNLRKFKGFISILKN
jgi:gliding motility-associated-like protein